MTAEYMSGSPETSGDPSGDRRVCGASILIGGIAGSLGVALAAIGSHLPGGELLLTASQMLLFHAPAFLALACLRGAGPRIVVPASVFCLAAGLLFFCGDLSLRTLLGERAFPMAAPIGGGLMILGWTGVATLGILRLMRRT
jgi:uncharacterized membrane protein YgdD (TMEM256/DUF423 family)